MTAKIEAKLPGSTPPPAIPVSPTDLWPLIRKQLERLEPDKTPSAQDIAEAALSVLSDDRKAVWRDILSGISTLRNKLSHSKPTASPRDQERLRKGGMGDIIGHSGELNLHPGLLPLVVQKLLEFCDEIDRARPVR